jgi:hypothetical protein
MKQFDPIQCAELNQLEKFIDSLNCPHNRHLLAEWLINRSENKYDLDQDDAHELYIEIISSLSKLITYLSNNQVESLMGLLRTFTKNKIFQYFLKKSKSRVRFYSMEKIGHTFQTENEWRTNLPLIYESIHQLPLRPKCLFTLRFNVPVSLKDWDIISHRFKWDSPSFERFLHSYHGRFEAAQQRQRLMENRFSKLLYNHLILRRNDLTRPWKKIQEDYCKKLLRNSNYGLIPFSKIFPRIRVSSKIGYKIYKCGLNLMKDNFEKSRMEQLI